MAQGWSEQQAWDRLREARRCGREGAARYAQGVSRRAGQPHQRPADSSFSLAMRAVAKALCSGPTALPVLITLPAASWISQCQLAFGPLPPLRRSLICRVLSWVIGALWRSLA